MKKFKILLSFVCVLVFICNLFVPAFAESADSHYIYLLNIGYSESFLSSISDEMINAIYDSVYGLDVYSVEEYTCSLDEFGNLQPFGTINNSSLIITLDVAAINKAGTDEITLFLYTASWEWAQLLPAIRNKDAISVNWDSSVFRRDSFYAQDTYKSNASDEWTIKSDTDTASATNIGGIGYYTSLSYGYNYIGGAMLLLLKPVNKMYNGMSTSTIVNLRYVHNRNPLGAGVSFATSGNKVTISAGSLSDYTINNLFFTYNNS